MISLSSLGFVSATRQQSKINDGTYPGKFPKARFTTVSIIFAFLNDENNRNLFFSISISCIAALKLCYKTKALFRDLENPKLLFIV